ncbi:MAG: Ig-like domain-containing protein [Alphaproteobacteria bacterium]
MAVLMSLGGNSASDGFLVAPLDSTYDAELALWTSSGTESVTLQASPNVAGLVFSTTAVSLSTTPTIVQVHATLQSGARGDTTIQVLVGTSVVKSFTVTSIKRPTVNFKGRFEARFATDGATYASNPMYTATLDTVVPPGWTWGLEGEPDFAPGSPVPTNLEMPVGRAIRLNNPLALRTHAAPVVSTVNSITGETSTGSETFTTGDPLIGQPVNFGPNTYFAGNQPSKSGDSPPEEFWAAQNEPLALFEIRLGNGTLYFRGASKVSPPSTLPPTPATMQNQQTRTVDSRPKTPGAASASAEMAEFGLPNLQTFSETRIALLVTEYTGLAAGPAKRNAARRVGHLLPVVSATTKAAVQAANPGAFTVRPGTISVWNAKEDYDGKVDTDLHALPGGSSVVDYLRQFFSFDVHWTPFSFHSDELCGHHKGWLRGDVSMTGNHIGDPHTHTVNGTTYDFQSVGEFTLLRDGARMEIQVRQTPVPTANPATDSHSGLTSCVSVITAVAARVGRHRLALQPAREGKRLELYVDGKPANFSTEGIDLAGSRASAFDANGETGLRVDYDNGTVLLATPAFWGANNVWYIDVHVSKTKADEGIMGFVPKNSWLPRLRNGAAVGPRPANLHDRYVALYKTFADSWRVTDNTSLFVYAPGTSTKTFTDPDWPAEKPPCRLKPEFQIPGVDVHKGMPVAEAEVVCRAVTMKDLNANCVFDVATTGDKIFAEGYLLAQELRLSGTSVEIVGHEPLSRPGRSPVTADEPRPAPGGSIVVTATVSPLAAGRPRPTGSVMFFVDGVPAKRPTELDGQAQARTTLTRLKPGEHKIRAAYSGGGKLDYHSSSSPNLLYTVATEKSGTPESPNRDRPR